MRTTTDWAGLISFLLLATPVAGQDPIGGWHEELWSSQYRVDWPIKPVRFGADLNGDGRPELTGASVTTGDLYWLDPVTGRAIFTYESEPYRAQHMTGFAADLDGDGATEFVIADQMALIPGGGSGRIMVFRSGPEEGELLWSIDESASRPAVGVSLALSDIDGDRLPDVIGSTSHDWIEAWSGASRKLLWKTQLEAAPGSLTPVTDRNGDGIDELLVTGIRKTWLMDGASGVPIWEANVGGSGPLHVHLEWAHLTHDGVLDLIAGFGRSDQIFAVDGANGNVLWNHDWEVGHDYFGAFFRLADLTGDGVVDVIAREYRETVHYPHRIAVDGRTGAEIWKKYWSTWSDAGRSCAYGDLNGDGIDDEVVLAVWGQGEGTVLEALDGTTGRSLWGLQAIYPGERLTEVQLADVDGDSVLDVIVSGNNPTMGWNDGLVRSLHGLTGSVLWEASGGWERARIGRRIRVAYLSGSESLLVCEAQSDDRRCTLVGLDIETGSLVWNSGPLGLSQVVEAMDVLDLDHDGNSEVLLQGGGHVYPLRGLELVSVMGGELLWSSGVVEHFYDGFPVQALPDINGDQTDEVLLNWSGHLVVCGATGGYSPGLQSNVRAVSASNPQDFTLHVHFPRNAIGYDYSLLWSENGVGASWGDTLIPLAAGKRLEESDRGQYPKRLFIDPRGEVYAQHQSIVVAASQWVLPPSTWGREIGFAVQFEKLGFFRPLVTVGLSVRILP